mmetsp:Transcript_26850/g.91660  ORF Transcript_26850/g.91660 Transcript_26850/m.91660 type:complete len:328 (-) Transcript_26850:309-1292(-)
MPSRAAARAAVLLMVVVPGGCSMGFLRGGGGAAPVAVKLPDPDADGIPAPGTRHAMPSQLEFLSWKPRAWVYRRLLTPAECDYLVEKARPNMQKSTVVDNRTGKSVASQIRTSSGTFFRKGEDAVIADIERRIAEFSMVPVQNGEGIQMLEYEIGQKYEAHYDYFHDKFNAAPERGGQRVATVLMYLTDVEEGGETVFPSSGVRPHAGDPQWSSCAQRGIAARPKKGDALLFYSLQLNGELDTSSLHAGCPVIAGAKWSATKWMHVGPFGGAGTFRTAALRGKCEDLNPSCEAWARAGECSRNAAYMVGADGSDGQCLKSCRKCTKD